MRRISYMILRGIVVDCSSAWLDSLLETESPSAYTGSLIMESYAAGDVKEV